MLAVLDNDFDTAALESTKTGRPLSFKRLSTIEGAMNLFWDNGVTGVSTIQLAKAMNIQRSSFYNSFGDKESVFSEALNHYEMISPDRWLTVIKPKDPVLPQLKGYLKELCRVRAADSKHRGCLFYNAVTELGGQNSKLGQILSVAANQRLTLLESLFDQAESQGEIPKGRYSDDLSANFIAFVIGLNTLSKLGISETRLWQTCELYLTALHPVVE